MDDLLIRLATSRRFSSLQSSIIHNQSSIPKDYFRSKLAVGLGKLGLAFAFILVVLLTGVSSRLHGLLRGLTANYYLQLTGYLLVFLIGYSLVLFGLDFYGDVVLERRYGLSNQTIAGWLVRSVKAWLLSAVLAILSFDLLYALFRMLPDWWWLAASAGWFAMLVLMGKIAPAVIVPLFYKLQPLPDRDLTGRLLALAQRCGVRVRQVFEIRLSKETKKANAAVIGLGNERRIVIGDTLMDLCTHDEIEAVFAHELGHVALRHGWKFLAAAAVSSVAGFYILHLFYARSAMALGFAGQSDIAAIPLLMLWLMAGGLIAKPFQAALSRRFERQADLFIVGKVPSPETLASSLNKLAGRNLADPEPSRLVELLFYTHPPIAKRIAYLRGAAREDT
ncbi:MAG: M48 family metallopeptidase [Phycisphaerales bacterium]